MIPVLLIGIPLLAGLIGFSLKDTAAKRWALFASLLTLGVMVASIVTARRQQPAPFQHDRLDGAV